MTEVWKDIPGYEGRYEASSLGRIRSMPRGVIRKQETDGGGYKRVTLAKTGEKKKWLLVHRLVALAFLSNPEDKPQINHRDGVKANNCVSNLEWCTAKENKDHAMAHGLAAWREGRPVLQIKGDAIVACFPSIAAASKATGVARGNIGHALHHRTYKGYTYLTAGGYEWKFEEEDMDK